MYYETVVEKNQDTPGHGTSPSTARIRNVQANGDRKVKRFPPVLQFLTDVDPAVVNKLQALAWKGHKAGRSLQEICTALHAFARQIGYDPAIGVQEVQTSNMPSYPGETVMTALIMLDLRTVEQTSYGKAG